MPVPGRHGGEGGVNCGAEAEPGQPSAEQGAAATKETGIPIIFDRDKNTIYRGKAPNIRKTRFWSIKGDNT